MIDKKKKSSGPLWSNLVLVAINTLHYGEVVRVYPPVWIPYKVVGLRSSFLRRFLPWPELGS